MTDSLGNIKYGNEWIDYSKQYYKILVADDGIFRINYQQLKDSGIDIGNIQGKDFQLFNLGEEYPVFTSTNGIFGPNDFIEFYGKKNRSDLDYFLFESKSYLFNPEYSLFNDTSAYFLTWNKTSTNKRYKSLGNDLSGNIPTVESYYIHQEEMVNHEYFNKPLRSIHNHIYKSNFEIGEGFGSKMQKLNSFVLNTSNVFNSGIDPVLSIRYSTGLGKHNIDININEINKKQEIKTGFYCGTTIVNLNQEELTDQITVTLKGNNDTDFEDRNSVSIIKLSYSREFDFQNKSLFKFNIKPSDEYRYFEIKNFDVESNSIVLYDTKNNTRLIPRIENNLVKFILPPSDSIRNLILVNLDKQARPVSSLTKKQFVDYSQYKDRNYLIVSDKDRFIDGNSNNWVETYADYRTSVKGGSYRVLTVNINDIYDQFGYGIDRHNIALNNFIIYFKDHFTNPDYVFIIGKGLEYNEIRTSQQLNDNKDLFYVPTYGFPGSDNLLAARSGKSYPDLPIGRIAAKNYHQIASYLSKVKKYEDYSNYGQTIEEKEWMKKVIHLVGGTADIIKEIDNNLSKMGDIIHNNKYGGEIHTYKRTSGDIEESVSKRIIDDINSGASIVTFYGHSGITGTDFNIGSLRNDKFPVFYSLGCYSGNIHTNIKNGQSEEFVLDTTGMIAYIGTSGTGFTGSLVNLGKKIYELTGGDLYGEGVGKIVQRAVKFEGETHSDIGAVTLNQQFTFHGDPAISLYKHTNPDYIIDNKTLQTDTKLINSTDKSFNINFDIVNLGIAVNDSLQVKIIRQLADKSEKTIFHTFSPVKSRKNVSFNIKTLGLHGVGENCFSIFLDPLNKIKESPQPEAENNNYLFDDNGEFKYCVNILNNKIKPVSPQVYGIVSDKNVELRATTLNCFVKEQDFVFQLDTTEQFNSPLMIEESIKSNGGLVAWNPDLEMKNETVYYWRVSPDGEYWENSSFVFLENGNEGWNQSHYFQYLNDEFNGTRFTNRKLDFVARKYSLKIIGKKHEESNRKIAFVDGEGWGSLNPKTRPSICITGWGPKYWYRNKSGHDFNSIPNNNKYGIQFVFDPKVKEQRQGIKELLEAMPDSMIVFVYTVLGNKTQSLSPETWAKDSLSLGYNLFGVLENYGAEKIRLMQSKGTVPYVLVFKKGQGILQEKIGETIDSKFEIVQDVIMNSKYGNFNSSLIGPSTFWDKLKWSQEITGDTAEFSYLIVHKLSEDLTKDIIIDTLINDYELDLTGINAKEYPYLKLYYYANDKYKRDPPNINFWRVFYKSYPDLVLNRFDESFLPNDTIVQGDTFEFKSSIYNNSSTGMDSILVKYEIYNDEKEVHFYKRYAPLNPFETEEISFEYPITKYFAGNIYFSVTINAGNEQKEVNYDNNTGIKGFYVKFPDKTNEVVSDTGIKVYPNPFENGFIFEGNFENNLTKVKLISTTGTIVYSKVFSKGFHSVKLNGLILKPGIYFLKIRDNKKISVNKIIKL